MTLNHSYYGQPFPIHPIAWYDKKWLFFSKYLFPRMDAFLYHSSDCDENFLRLLLTWKLVSGGKFLISHYVVPAGNYVLKFSKLTKLFHFILNLLLKETVTLADELNTCLKSSILWQHVQKLNLKTNTHVQLQHDTSGECFAKQPLDVGNLKMAIDE